MKSRIGTAAIIACAAMLTVGAAPPPPQSQSMPASGVYRVSWSTTACLRQRGTGSATEQPYFQYVRCGESGPVVRLTALGNGWYRVSNLDGTRCATVARGVIFGAPRVDSLRCENAQDQRFQIELGSTGVRFKSTDGRCWSPRGNVNSLERFKADLVMEGCKPRTEHAGRVQWFTLRPVIGPPSEDAPD